MSNLLVPHDVSSAGADVWLASVDETSFDGFLTYGAGTATMACDAPTGYVASSTDCNDGDSAS